MKNMHLFVKITKCKCFVNSFITYFNNILKNIFADTYYFHEKYLVIFLVDCCFGNECWCFTSHGLCTVGQDEIMIIMERLPGEKAIPRDIFKLFSHVYDSASKGKHRFFISK